MNGAHAHHQTVLTSEEATRDLLSRTRVSAGIWVAAAILAIVALFGLMQFIALVGEGPLPRAKWGFAAATLAFILSTAQAAPVVAFASRLAKGYWAVPVRRIAELYSVAGFVTAPMFIFLLFQLPEWKGRPSIWFDWPGAPHYYDSIAIILLAVLGLALLYMSSLPDFAAARDAGIGPFSRSLALGWTGTAKQWKVLTTGLILLGAFYLMWYTFVHLFLVADLAMSLVPGWKSSVFPPYHAISGLQAGLSLTLVTAAVLRKVARLERYIGVDPFWGASKILLGLSLLFFYFTWSEFLPSWYGRLPEELDLIKLQMAGPYMGHFLTSFTLCFVAPFSLLIWNRLRQSIAGPTLVASLVLTGNLVDRVRIYSSAWSVAGPVGQHLEHIPAVYVPTGADIAILAGAVAAVFFAYVIALRLLPPVSLWELKSTMLYKAEVEYLRAEVAVVAKPN